jgi:uncharacterized protein YlxW (UPF0749 family)
MGMHSAPRRYRPARTSAEARYRLRRSLSPQRNSTQLLITVLFVILGFTLTAAIAGSRDDSILANARQSDLVSLLDDLAQREARLEAENTRLEDARETLLGGDEYSALNEAKRRADALGVLAGSEAAAGFGIEITISGNLTATTLIDALQEIRDAGATAIQISDPNLAIRLVANSWFSDSASGVTVSGTALEVPIKISVIGDPAVLKPAIEIPGGLIDTVGSGGGQVVVEENENVEITAIVPLPNS